MKHCMVFLLLAISTAYCDDAILSVAGYPSIQEAIDANPGKVLFVPDGEYIIDRKVRLAGKSAGLWGYGTIIQTNPDEPILEIEHADNMRIEGLTFTRQFARDTEGAQADGISIWDSKGVDLNRVRVWNNRSQGAGIRIRDSSEISVIACEIRDYKRIGIDDRTSTPLYGYAFRCIDGSGITVEQASAVQLLDNRVVEERLLPTRETKEKHSLGSLCEGRQPTLAGRLGENAVRDGYVNNWHQGSAIVITQPERTSHVLARGNYIAGSAQGIDIHADYVSIVDNIVDHAMIGIKATHGARNLLISGNLLTHIDLWGILLNPGALSHAAEPPTDKGDARPENVDAGTIISSNIISHFGFGHEFWNWGGKSEDHDGGYGISLRDGQLPENPPLRDILIMGNIVYDSDRDSTPGPEGKPSAAQPRYRYALHIGSWHGPSSQSPNMPQGVLIRDNIFHPGTGGISNVEF